MKVITTFLLTIAFIASAFGSNVNYACTSERAAMLDKRQLLKGSFIYDNFKIEFKEDFTRLIGLRDRIDLQPYLECKKTHATYALRCADLFNWESFTFDTESLRFVYVVSTWFGHLNEPKPSASGNNAVAIDDFMISGQCRTFGQ